MDINSTTCNDDKDDNDKIYNDNVINKITFPKSHIHITTLGNW